MKKKGFTLIELLAVIVILGLLMAIAIPSVTKYITQSRKKTITTTIGNYIGALTNQVNDMEYTFTEANTVYAVPIECIALERGGTNPFGEWMQASNSYWAYVLVQYDDSTSSYTYGFTFKDSAGYGLYPTTSEKLKESGSQINTDLDLTRPSNGTITNITDKANWTGFNLEDDTALVVLEAESEGTPGDGKTTCTLCQKGKNYNEVEEEKEIAKEETLKDYTLMVTTQSSTTAFWNYRTQIKTITFQDSINIPSDISNEYKWDVSTTGNGKVMAYMTTNATDSNYYDLFIQGDGKIYANSNSSYLFYNFKYVDSITNIELLNTSKTTNMSSMFNSAGMYATTFNLDLSNWDTSKVTNMVQTFYQAGMYATTFNIGNTGKWDVSNVTSMDRMFCWAGMDATTWNIGDLSNWNTSNVTNMLSMFYGVAKKTSTWNIGDLSNWDTSKVTNMTNMFFMVGYNALSTFDIGNIGKWDVSSVTSMSGMFDTIGCSHLKVFNIGDLSNWNTSKVTNMSSMFYTNCNNKLTSFNIGNIGKWDVSNVTSMSRMFYSVGKNVTTFYIGDLSNWDTSKVTDMSYMFAYAGQNKAATFEIGNLSRWNTSQVTNMSSMFNMAGQNSSTFYIGNLSGWNTSKVTDMSYMFYWTGSKASWSLNCKNWNVNNVTKYTNFNYGVSGKVTPPTWK